MGRRENEKTGEREFKSVGVGFPNPLDEETKPLRLGKQTGYIV